MARPKKDAPPRVPGSRECFPVVGAEARRRLTDMFERLLAHFGPRGWWPSETPFETMVGAVLTQNTAWKNAERAVANLRRLGLTTPEALRDLGLKGLSEAIRPAGCHNVKAGRLLALCDMVLRTGSGGESPGALSLSARRLREELLRVPGVGPETADCIVLYAAGRPSFVVDAYSRRILSRHGLLAGDPPYEDVRLWFMGNLENEAPLFNEFHALLDAAGHDFCLRGSPRCRLCPLGGDPFLGP